MLFEPIQCSSFVSACAVKHSHLVLRQKDTSVACKQGAELPGGYVQWSIHSTPEGSRQGLSCRQRGLNSLKDHGIADEEVVETL